MKQLDSGISNSNWGNQLLNDLAYIKRHKRYPLSKKTIRPLAIIFILLSVVARLCIPVIFIKKTPAIVIALLVILCVSIIAYFAYGIYTTLVFKKINTRFYLQENRSIIEKFFKSLHLAYTIHPDAAEVFMIMSTPIASDSDQREIMIFIACDKVILLNSHFSGKKPTVYYPSKQYKSMIKTFTKWVNEYSVGNTSTTIAK